MLRVTNIKLSLDEDESLLKSKVAKKLRIQENTITSYRIFKKSIDARRKNKIHFVYTLDVELKNEGKILKLYSKKGVSKVNESKHKYEKIAPQDTKRPI